MAFQLGGERKLLTRCHHDSTGPPLKSYLFDVDDAAFSSVAACYAHHTCDALAFLRETYNGLPLHDRLAVLCPDAAFAAAFGPELVAACDRRFPEWSLSFVSAAQASAHVGAALDGSCLPSDGRERLVLDTVDQFDGLERLVVIAVGLDQVCASPRLGPRPLDLGPDLAPAHAPTLICSPPALW